MLQHMPAAMPEAVVADTHDFEVELLPLRKPSTHVGTRRGEATRLERAGYKYKCRYCGKARFKPGKLAAVEPALGR